MSKYSFNLVFIKTLSKTLFCIAFFVFTLFIVNQNTFAQTKEAVYESLDVTYQINQDSTVDVEEDITMRYDGTFRGTARQISLIDDNALERCQNNPSLQCGGFDFIYINEIIGEDGEALEDDEYELRRITVGGDTRLEIRYEFDADGREFDNENFNWKIRYKAFGSMGYFSSYQLFYWDTAFADRTDPIESMEVDLIFDKKVEISESDIDSDNRYRLNENISKDKSRYTFQFPNGVPMYNANTLLVRLPPNTVDEPGRVKVQPQLFGRIPWDFADSQLLLNGKEIINNDGTYEGMPTGKYDIKIEFDDYESITTNISVDEGELITVRPAIRPNILTMLIGIIIISCNLLSLPLVFFGFGYPLWKWNKYGRDENTKDTIIPEFKPPEGITPALLGAIKDEVVHTKEISATLVNVAYKGYIKIKEVSKKEFLFTKLKDFNDLPSEEKKIISNVFDDKDQIETSDLKNKFYRDIPSIKSHIYNKMVDLGLFDDSPKKIRDKYRGIGIGSMSLPAFAVFFLGPLTGGWIFLFALFPLFALFIYGLSTLLLSGAMPAKTSKGSKILAEIKGFKMYLETAEKHTLQDLTPELFEKYLAYAIVFGIEKKWAEKFEGIYEGKPDWYESEGGIDVFTPIYLSNVLSSATSSTSSVMTSQPSSSSSSSSFGGGGWSGGGGFSGGFSGGGAGGGGGSSW